MSILRLFCVRYSFYLRQWTRSLLQSTVNCSYKETHWLGMHRQSETRAGQHRRHTRTRKQTYQRRANNNARGARKQPPNQGTIHAASEQCVTDTSESRTLSWRTQRISALSPAEVPATLEQWGSRDVGTPADCMTWHQVVQRMLRRAGAAFERAERSLAKVGVEGAQPGPRSRIARVARAWGGGTTPVGTETRCRTHCCSESVRCGWAAR